MYSVFSQVRTFFFKRSPTDTVEKPCIWSSTARPCVCIVDRLRANIVTHGWKVSITALFRSVFRDSLGESFVYDEIFGLQSRRDFLIKTFLLVGYIKTIDSTHVGIMLPSTSMTSMTIMATLLAGKIPVMLNWTLGERAFLHCVDAIPVTTVLTTSRFYTIIQNTATEKLRDRYVFLDQQLASVSLWTKLQAFLRSIIFPIGSAGDDDQAVVLFTSGSESLPKAVPLTHRNIVTNILGSLALVPITEGDRLLSFLPPFHSFGFTVNTILPLITGLPVVYTPNPHDTATVLRLIETTGATVLTTTPAFLGTLLSSSFRQELRTITYAVVGAQACSQELFSHFSQVCPQAKILEGYGITECSPVVTINPLDRPKIGSVGIPIEGSDIRIISLQDGAVLKAGMQGMIFVSGAHVFHGYMDTSIESPFVDIDGVRYYRSGDLGYRDSEGYLYITGRLTRFVKVSGEMVSLPFVESLLTPVYDPQGQGCIAVEAREYENLTQFVLFSLVPCNLNEVAICLRAGSIDHLVRIGENIVLPELPLLGTGKIDYARLRALMCENSPIVYDFLDIETTLRRKLADLARMPIEHITLQSVFGRDIPLDSIDVGELTMFFRTHYPRTSSIDFRHIQTVADLLSLVQW